ncbi:prepilin-type N-terminal cleavage/methylation domain-containing protein [Actinoplanes sp. NPDC051411]|uniref:prepilin-type N-terminal cleavage/methylation domain-containing protein n=1 Tax=Actinoplanes sp. NPDC051411 TaxID=3155522 RepID=UPI00341A94E0
MKPAASNDEGYSLIEVMMAMVCTGILMTLVTSAVIQIYHSVNSVDAVSAAQSQVDTTFARLDKEVRYARGISDPATVGGDPYVEYLLNVDSVDTCVELRLHAATGELQRRSWLKNQTPPAPTGWLTLASSVTATKPFAVTIIAQPVGTTDPQYQTLALDVTSVTGGGPGLSASAGRAGSERETKVTFTALNAVTAGNSSICTEGRGISS